MEYSNCVIDISHWQKITNFDAIRNDGIVGVIHKATESMGYIDAKYQNRKNKLLEKQKKGKKRMKNVGNIEIPTDTFIKLLKN